MHHQFKELADVDITAEPMEVGPTCHYVMGGVEVDPDTEAAARVPGLFAAGEVAGGMHGSNRLGGNSLSDLLVFGRRAGDARRRLRGCAVTPNIPASAGHGRSRPSASALSPLEAAGGENPYTLHQELQQTMNDLVGIIRKEEEMREALAKLEELKSRVGEAQRRGHSGVQSGLASGAGPAQHAAGQRVRRPGGPAPPREPGRSYPGRLSGDGGSVAAGQSRLLGRATVISTCSSSR